MRAQVLAAIRAVAVFTVLVGIAYPLVVTGIAQVAFDDQADGSLIEREGRVLGSRLVGQAAEGDRWFHPRPSAAGDGYDATSSGASNLGPTDDELLDEVSARVAAYRRDNALGVDERVPVDAVTSSGSGLDPHISIANARLQADRVAEARGLDREVVLRLIDANTAGRSLGFLGEPGVNVVDLNLALQVAG